MLALNAHQTIEPTTRHIAATVADLLPENETDGPLQCWATPADRRKYPPDANNPPCKNAGTDRLGMCPEHAAEFIDGPRFTVASDGTIVESAG